MNKGFCSRPLFSVWHDTAHPLWWGWVVAWFLSVVLAVGSRPVPFRTRKLSPPAPMVLHSGGCGRVGRRRHNNLFVGRGCLAPLCGVGAAAAHLLFYPRVNGINYRFNAYGLFLVRAFCHEAGFVAADMETFSRPAVNPRASQNRILPSCNDH